MSSENNRIWIIKLILLIGLTFLYSFNNKTDSLKIELEKANSDSVRIKTYLNICGEIYNYNSDSANEIMLHVEKLINETRDEDKAKYLFQLSDYYRKIGKYKLSVKNNKIAISLLNKNNIETNVLYNNHLALTYIKQGKYKLAIDIFFTNIRLIEKNNIEKHEVQTHVYLGYAYSRMLKYDKAHTFYKKGLELSDSTDENYHNILNEIGNVYVNKGILDSAFYFLNKSLELRERMDNKGYLVYSYNDIASAYYRIGELEKALLYYEKCFHIKGLKNEDWDRSFILMNMGNIHMIMGNFDEALEYLLQSLAISKKLNSRSNYEKIYQQLKVYYSVIGDFEKAFEYSELHHTYKDSIWNKEVEGQISEYETLYKTERKDKEIKLLKKDKQNQKILRNFLIFSILILIVIAFLIYRNFKIKKKANKLLRRQNNEIREQKAELENQRDEILAQRDEIANQSERIELQRNLLFKQKQEITNSIQYASLIQQAALPGLPVIKNLLPDSFVYYQPQSIVGGDFYWINKIDDKVIVAVADCTGHGVPGGFMSMLGIALLNEIVNKERKTELDKILKRLRAEIIESLKQENNLGSIKDGMDIAICSFDFKNKTMSFAGAMSSILIVKKRTKEELGEDKCKEYIIEQIKGDLMPISISDIMDDFTLHTFSLEEVKAVYMYSDGFADQFGGERKRKFNKGNFRKLLFDIAEKPSEKQNLFLETEHKKWKGNNPQTDDILVLGINIK